MGSASAWLAQYKAGKARMNKQFLSGWLALARWQRYAYCLLCGSLMTLIVWLLWARPASADAAAIASKKSEAMRHYRNILRQTRQYGALSVIAADIAGLEAAVRAVQMHPFSLLELLDEAGGELLLWQPEGHGGSLTLLLSWEQVKNVLLYLSERHAGIALRHFSLRREGERLRLQMTLEVADEI
ncbi:hypothetical protein ACQK5W_01400 [Pantoea sp. FN060301]|uniref:HofO family protein n=1 Tax=Pantoea sp. FN060301 TaxID=3420380 RepID=UPI003D182964